MRRSLTRYYPDYAPEALFALVDDIESYPSFAPFCLRARVLAREGDWRRVENIFGFGSWRSTFVSESRATPPRELVVESYDRPFRALRLRWLFEPRGAGCRLTCDWRMEFSSPLLNIAAALAAEEAQDRALAAFERRAALTIGKRETT
ncbi:type II toxin-antitoxin system RatA family toxin [Rhodoblastus sp.]|uniref:type II toxin-antitoxin system RatA family toxin n=1 Tax=Rhodoblastus sp. TaxID=1962975 RepID=UPI003F946C78